MVESAHNMGALKEGFADQVKMLAELIKDRPTRSEVRETVRSVVKEEARPIIQEEIHRLVLPHFVGIRSEFRTITQNHEKRLNKLEVASAH